MILSFEGYSFCKAHSAAYSLVAYKLAHLRLNRPLEFFLAVINNGGGYYTTQTYLNECRRLGVRILPVDVNASQLIYTPEGEAIRIGLGQLREVSLRLKQRIIRERLRGPYKDIVDFIKRLSPGLPAARILIRSGADLCAEEREKTNHESAEASWQATPNRRCGATGSWRSPPARTSTTGGAGGSTAARGASGRRRCRSAFAARGCSGCTTWASGRGSWTPVSSATTS